MIRVDRSHLTRNEIIRAAANRFLSDGYNKTTVSSIAKALNMSTGNLTFHFPTKDHMLAELTQMLCRYQWQLMEAEAKDGVSSVTAICLELLTMASACEQNETARDFFLSSYKSELCMEIIRRNDKERAKEVFKDYCEGWDDERFEEAEMLVSGIEYAALMETSQSAPLPTRIRSALRAILSIYHVPREIQEEKISQVLKIDYKTLSKKVYESFKSFVDTETEKALLSLFARKQMEASL